MPISISPSPSSKVGLPAAGRIVGEMPDAHRPGGGDGGGGGRVDLVERVAPLGCAPAHL